MLRIAISRVVLFIAGLALLTAALFTSLTGPVGAAPSPLITETPNGEPPTRTPVPPPTAPPVATPTTIPDPGDGGGGGSKEDPTSTPTQTSTPMPTSTLIILLADPVIVKSVDITKAEIGDAINFTLTVTNPGNATASNVVVSDSLPDFLSLEGVSATRGDVQVNGGSVQVTIGDLAAGETVSITITARVTTAATPPDNRNVATLTTSSETDNPNNNRSEVSLSINQPPAPARLPNTSDPTDLVVPALLILGLTLISASLFTRRHQN